MPCKSTWKNKERWVATWFESLRNPLSGSNNVSDDLQKRQGDVIYKYAVIEVKSRKKSPVLRRGIETLNELTKRKVRLPFLHVEVLNGSNRVVGLILTAKEAEDIVRNYLRPKWEGSNGGKRARGRKV